MLPTIWWVAGSFHWSLQFGDGIDVGDGRLREVKGLFRKRESAVQLSL